MKHKCKNCGRFERGKGCTATDYSGKIIFIKKDAIVQVLDKDSGSDLDVLVQDLSKRKIADGVWWISHECLEIIERKE